MKEEQGVAPNRKFYSTVIGVMLAVAFFIGMAVFGKKEMPRAEKTFLAMDTYMTVTAYGEHADEAVEAAKNLIVELDQMLSTGISTSEISKLNQEKTAQLSDKTSKLMERALEIARDTEGDFDITLYPVSRAWGFTGEGYRVPSETELAELVSNVGYTQVRYQANESVKLPNHVEIDFGGIGKGYASQLVAELMEQYGVQSAQINLGGNIQLVGQKPDHTDWNIAIRHPKLEDTYIGAILAHDMAIVTSGGYERFFEEAGQRYHHILDPGTGKPVDNGILSVTIVCQDGTMADALSTALFVKGEEKAIDYWKARSSQFDMVLLMQDGRVRVTDGLKNQFSSKLSYEWIAK